MKAQRKALQEELLQVLGPHLASGMPAGQKVSKGLLKTIHQLADQLLRARLKQQQHATPGVSPTSLMTQQLTQTLTTALDTQLGAHEYSSKKAAQAITESAEHLASKLVKLQLKQKKQRTQSDAPLGIQGASTPPALVAALSRPAGARAKRPSQRVQSPLPPPSE